MKNNICNNNNVYTSFVILTISLGLFFTATVIHPANAATTNATQGAQSAANQTGEKMQGGAANMTQGAKSIMNKTGETLQSFANKTGEVLQKINPLK